MKLYIVPTTHVQQYWHLAEPLLQLALDKGNDEFTADQLKLMLTQGNQQLLLLMKEDKVYCALTVQWIVYPNDRVLVVRILKQDLNNLKIGQKVMVELLYKVLLNLKV